MKIYKKTIRLKNGKEKTVPYIKGDDFDRRMTLADKIKFKELLIKTLGEDYAL